MCVCVCVYLCVRTILPQQDSHIVLCLGADVHQDSRSAGSAETEGHVLPREVHPEHFRLAVHSLCVPAGACYRFRKEVVLDQSSCLEETSDIWT